MAKRVLLESPYFHISVDDDEKLVRAKRTDRAYPTIEALRAANAERIAVFEPIAGKGYVLLLDMRDGPMRNDPAFEEETRKARLQLFHVFYKVAILLRTAVGMLQLERLKREEQEARGATPMQTFDDEAAALAFLRS